MLVQKHTPKFSVGDVVIDPLCGLLAEILDVQLAKTIGGSVFPHYVLVYLDDGTLELEVAEFTDTYCVKVHL